MERFGLLKVSLRICLWVDLERQNFDLTDLEFAKMMNVFALKVYGCTTFVLVFSVKKKIAVNIIMLLQGKRHILLPV